MKKIPENSENRDDKDFQEYMAGGKPDPDREEWLDDFKDALRELGFDDWSVQDVIDDPTLKLRFDMDAEDFAETVRFCVECEWTGVLDELEAGRCPGCGEKI